jgi:hypothetical protein
MISDSIVKMGSPALLAGDARRRRSALKKRRQNRKSELSVSLTSDLEIPKKARPLKEDLWKAKQVTEKLLKSIEVR